MNRPNKTLVTVFVAITITLVITSINNGSIINPALSKSSTSHHGKSSTETTNGVSSSSSGNSGSTLQGTNSNPSSSTGKSSSVTNDSVVNSSAKNNNKVVVLSFDDNRIGDFTYAKPILDKYGFKATFFVICGRI